MHLIQRNSFNSRAYHVSLAALAILLFASWAAAARRERLIDSWRPVNYDVSLVLNNQLSEITSAKTEITILSLKDGLSLIDLDFGDLPVDSVLVDGQPAKFEQTNQRLNVTLATPKARDNRILVTIVYHGTPKDGLILSADKSGKPSAIGDNWPNRLHHWIPCLDHPSAKATARFTVTAPERTLVVANGALQTVQNNADAMRTWTYTEKAPIPPYCMIIAVGEFAALKPQGPTVTPLSYYVPQSDRESALRGFASANPSLKFFSQTIAPYPYDKLALIVGATRFGGMENSGAIVFSSTLFDPRSNADPISRVFNVRSGIVSLVAHEIAHQWFGDSVTESTWSDLWLSEGFATYFAALFIQSAEGETAFKEYMDKAAKAYFGYASQKRTPLFDTETENLLSLLNANNYQKGAWVLHMLRGRLGDIQFFNGIRAYYIKHAHRTASSEDLRAALEKASGMNLKPFFERWVYAGGHPRYEASWKWKPLRNKGGRLAITLRQTQSDGLFLDPVSVEVVTEKGTQRTVIQPTGPNSTINFPLNSRPKTLRIDPDGVLLKEVVLK